MKSPVLVLTISVLTAACLTVLTDRLDRHAKPRIEFVLKRGVG